MERTRGLSTARAALAIAAVVSVAGLVAGDTETPVEPTASEEIISSVEESSLRLLLTEVVERNPRLARLEAEAAAVEQRTPQVKALPDPTATLTWFVMSPETRVGPQRAAINVMQQFPWFGTLKTDEQASLWDAVAARAKL